MSRTVPLLPVIATAVREAQIHTIVVKEKGEKKKRGKAEGRGEERRGKKKELVERGTEEGYSRKHGGKIQGRGDARRKILLAREARFSTNRYRNFSKCSVSF